MTYRQLKDKIKRLESENKLLQNKRVRLTNIIGERDNKNRDLEEEHKELKKKVSMKEDDILDIFMMLGVLPKIKDDYTFALHNLNEIWIYNPETKTFEEPLYESFEEAINKKLFWKNAELYQDYLEVEKVPTTTYETKVVFKESKGKQMFHEMFGYQSEPTFYSKLGIPIHDYIGGINRRSYIHGK